MTSEEDTQFTFLSKVIAEAERMGLGEDDDITAAYDAVARHWELERNHDGRSAA
jgi:hypothetical protein